jgi:hypothetical protein
VNRAILLAAVMFGASAIVVALGVREQIDEERSFAARCSSIAAGAEIDEVRAKARAFPGYALREFAPTEWAGPITVIAPAAPFWPASACTVRHNGSKVLSASYDPWYE